MENDGSLYFSPIIYPHIPWEEKGKIIVNEEFMAVKGGATYLSLDYEIKDIFLEELLEKYRERGFPDVLRNRGLYIRYGEARREPFVKKREEIVDALISVTSKTGKLSVSMYDVLAYQKMQKRSFLLTADGLYSPTELERYGRRIALHRLGRIDKDGVFGKNGDYLYKGRFATNFASLATELIALNHRIGQISVPHPLYRETENVREQYVNFLVYRLCADKEILAEWLIRVELIAGLLRVSLSSLSGMIGKTLEKRKMAEADQRKYYTDAFALLNFDTSGYRDILYYDILAFELFQLKGRMGRRASYFTLELENRLEISPVTAQNYMECLEKTGKGEIDLLEAMRHPVGEEQIRHHMAALELEIQKNLIGGNENGG